VTRARTKLTVRHAADPRELTRVLTELAEAGDAAFPLLVQQRIVGPGVGIFLLLWEGRVLATFAHRRIREKPPSGGVSVYRESIAADPQLVARSRALLEHLGWCGVAMVEYKVDERTGTPYLMEVNGRFWGSLQLAVDAGVDFPVLLVAAATGAEPEPVPSYTTGVRLRWWWGDVDHLIARMRRSRTALALPPDAPGRWRALRDFLTIHFGRDREEILRLDDPRPFLRESVQWFHL
jgi:predicted ATP-grasp superfamily ATP-dependent carboligase